MPVPREQLRLTPDELDELLGSAHTLRAGTVGPDGWPHVAPLWFLWRDGSIWLNSLRRSKRARDVAAGSPVALCVDDGEQYQELRGAILYGRFEAAAEGDELEGARRAYSAKYWGGIDIPQLRSHEWLRMRPERIVSWDFRKIPAGRDKRLEAVRGTDEPAGGELQGDAPGAEA